MHTLPKYEPTDSLNPMCEIFAPQFFSVHFHLAYFILSTLYFRLYFKLSIKHFNIQNKSTPDFPLAYHIKNYQYYNSAHSTSPAPQHYLTLRGKNRDKTGHFCDIFQKIKKRPKYLKKITRFVNVNNYFCLLLKITSHFQDK